MPALNHRTSSNAQCYTEPLGGLGGALPLQMLLIPGGTFLMGSPDDEPERFDHEYPQHEVTVPQFFMGRYPITQAQWRTVAALPQVDRRLEEDPSGFKGNDLPVERVSWYDAVEFCVRLENHTKRPYRLPSEAEWEYACRAGTTTPFYFGKTITTGVANYDGNYTYNDDPEGEDQGKTTSVNHFGIANTFGLSDMHGNVWEWCADHYHANYDDAPTDGKPWLDESRKGKEYVIRGGSWLCDPGGCRSASRNWFAPDFFSDCFGFRVCCSSPKSS
jgi:formylglycine-generating enzyme required for sulfatase activity